MSKNKAKAKPKGQWIPETPGGTVLMDLAASTETQAWTNLLKDAAHMPYKDIAGFKARGYIVEFWELK